MLRKPRRKSPPQTTSLSLAMSLSLALAALVSSAPAATAQNTLWQTFFNEAIADYQKSDLSAAEKAFDSALTQAKSFGESDQRYFKSMEGLALVYSREGKYAEAEPLFQKVMAIKEKALGSDNPEIALTMGNLADLYQNQGKYSAAEVLYRGSIKGLQKGSVPYLEKVQNLAVCYTQDGDYKQAEELLGQAIQIESTVFGAGSPQLAMTTLNLANLYVARGNYAAAESAANQVLTILKPGQEEHTRNAALTVLGIVYLRQGKFAQAEATDRLNLSNNQAASGPNSDSVARSLHNLAHTLRGERKYAEAEPLLNQARTIFEQSKSPALADTLAELGELNVDQGRYSQAEDYYNQAKALREKTYGDKHPDIGESYAQLAYIYAQRNDFAAAESAYKRALSIYKNSIGEKHPDYAKTLANLGLLYAQKKDNSNAEKYLSQALATREKILPPDHPDLSLNINQLAGFYRDSGSPAKAEPLYRRLLAMDKAAAADATNLSNQISAARQASDLDNLVDVLTAQNKGGDAQALQMQAQTLKKSLPGAAAASEASYPKEIAARAADSKPVSEKWCLCIGISNFKDSEINLKYAAKDATDFSKFIGGAGNFKADHVKLLVDGDATRDNIIAQLGEKWLGKEAKPDDLVIIYISSHGSTALQEANGTNFLVAYDTNRSSLLASGIPMQWLSQIIKEQVHSNRVLVILDVCHSGAAAEVTTGAPTTAANANGDAQGSKNIIGMAGGKGSAKDSKGIVRLRNFNVSQLPIGQGQIVLCSSAADQVSWESREYPNSVFTKRLIEALQSNGNATTLSQAYQVMRDKVEEEVLRDRGQMQTPVIKSTWQGADLAPLSDSPK